MRAKSRSQPGGPKLERKTDLGVGPRENEGGLQGETHGEETSEGLEVGGAWDTEDRGYVNVFRSVRGTVRSFGEAEAIGGGGKLQKVSEGVWGRRGGTVREIRFSARKPFPRIYDD